ncbi:MAG: endonuclease III [Bacteroidetes bacterium CG23_combo_of_CG06-09_8_20_14_all_32_9]|nr:MAG: endonuclease III [Bacteroidetes bacterium CG23_combo_of_CG06-09_8_20_14_all_32_9]
MNKKELFEKVIEYFSKSMPKPKTELYYSNPFHLLVAVILSAQCTDKRVNMITSSLFKRFPNPQSMANATEKDIFELIKSCSYPNNKAHNLHGMAKMLHENYKGLLPGDVDELQKLPGVGRKTANVVASVIYNKPVLAVDTHVFRVAARIGLSTKAKNPLETEKQLIKYFPASVLPDAHHWLILHGRYVCKARKPLCWECGIREWCKYANA